ncbi:hypothetical protein [Antiquaquibacter soli]|uniref:Secreted protein n=1 Tax=Antiquaquibacter soli TaxID=3064523 RepID=A0ABT9BJJ8_9MICO|nr:hypothetical protein [Protaetiibacter sp. WY-16]MDO7881196.1 hypothetical protein [Protaetiibacter sp. WY-16]
MDANEVTAVATVVAVAVSALFGLGGLVVGIIGLAQARSAKKTAGKANTLAKGANKLAKQANKLSKEANGLAESANTVVQEQAARETERTDVDWEWFWDQTLPNVVVVKNIGKALAKEVVVQFFFEGLTEAAGPLDVEGRHEVRLQIPRLAERRKDAIDHDELDQLGGAAGWELSDHALKARVRLRVTWTTPRGTPKLHDTGYFEGSLSPKHP